MSNEIVITFDDLIKEFISGSYYFVSADHPNARDYEIFYKGEKVSDVVGLLRRGEANE